MIAFLAVTSLHIESNDSRVLRELSGKNDLMRSNTWNAVGFATTLSGDDGGVFDTEEGSEANKLAIK